MKNKKKKIKKNKTIRNYNISIKSKLKTLIKKVKYDIKNNDNDSYNKNLKNLQSFIDIQSRKNIINKNKSYRIKSKLMKKII